MESNQSHTFYSTEEAEEDDEKDDIWRTQRELDARVEEQMSFDKPSYCNGNNEMVEIFFSKWWYNF